MKKEIRFPYSGISSVSISEGRLASIVMPNNLKIDKNSAHSIIKESIKKPFAKLERNALLSIIIVLFPD